MSDSADDRIYSVIEFLANQEQLANHTVKIRGPIYGTTESFCRIGDQSEGVNFDSGQLPEADRIAILKAGEPGATPKVGVLTLQVMGMKALKVEFET